MRSSSTRAIEAGPAIESDAVGPPLLNLLFGTRFVQLRHAEETAVNLVIGAGGGFVAFGLGADVGGQGFGMYVSLRAGEARALAANLLQLADTLDQGRGKQ